jgi:K+-sensing histidine kinase KdpD
MGTAASHLSELISGIHSYSKAVDINDEKSSFRVADLVEAVIAVRRLPEHVTVSYDKDDKKMYSCQAALMQMLLQLIDYTITVNNKEAVEISISFAEEKDNYIIIYKDNGRGIPAAEKENIFDLFKALQKKIKGDETAVTGLSVVKKLADKMDGSVSVTTGLDRGVEFIIRLSK